MKDQYFGDVNDFRKYALLRSLVMPDHLRLGVCWMLTDGDRRKNGSRLAYLSKQATYRTCDAALFDWLKQVIDVEQDRRTARIEESDLLGATCFQSNILTDDESERRTYFSECSTRLADCDLVFFDPDNGLEVKSIPRGRKNSHKYLYWGEVCSAFSAGSSVVIYQHFIREKRASFITRLAAELNARTHAAAVFSFATPHVLFLLASQEHHTVIFRRRLAAIQSSWAPARIMAAEHLHSTEKGNMIAPLLQAPEQTT